MFIIHTYDVQVFLVHIRGTQRRETVHTNFGTYRQCLYHGIECKHWPNNDLFPIVAGANTRDIGARALQ